MASRPRVLIIDPSPAVLDAIELLLQDEGYAVSTARGLVRPLDLGALRPDVVICEPVVPHRPVAHGVAAVFHLQAAYWVAPVILCTTAVSFVEPCRARLEARGFRIVYKPFDIEALLQAVADGLRGGPKRRRAPVCVDC